MKKRLAIINILVPLMCLGLLFAIPLGSFFLPHYVVLGLVVFTLVRSYILLQQQTTFSVLPIILLLLPSQINIGIDIYAPFALHGFLLYLTVVNLQWGQRSWFHPFHICNFILLIIFIVLAMRLISLPDAWLALHFPVKWFVGVSAILPLLFFRHWTRPGRWAGYWPILAIVVFEFRDDLFDYVILWMSLASLFSLAIDSYLLAFVDELTGILGRRAMMFKLKTSSKGYGLVMIDVDHFKKFNDDHGHQVGDDVLKIVAKIISQTSGAKAYRYGGEEFTLLFPKKTIEELIPHIEATRLRIANYALYPKQLKLGKQQRGKIKKPKALSVTASFGLAVHQSRERPEQVIERADKALYEAKNKGRNQLVTSA